MSLDPGHPEFKAFVRSMRADHRDDTCRLVMCDWLEEYYPAVGLHHLFRSMIEIGRESYQRLGLRGWEEAHPPPFQPRGDLFAKASWALNRTWANWDPLRNLGPASLLWRWHRGTIDSLTIDWETWARHWHQIIAFGPVGQVVFHTRPSVDFLTYHTYAKVQFRRIIFGREVRACEASVQMKLREWQELDRIGQMVMLNVMTEKLLAQVWGEDEVADFRIDEDALNGLTDPEPPASPGT